jgi:formylglycine-generating enzyme required for sulfatase activity
MRRLLVSLLSLAFLSGLVSAQTLTETFGTGANAFTMDFVTIGNPGNAADTTGSPNPAGSVAYAYNIGKYEVSREQITKANSDGSLGVTLESDWGWGIYGGPFKPAYGLSWNEAATFVNWLNTSQGYHAAYKFSGSTFQLWSPADAGYNANNLFRNNLAKYVIASTDEWYKAAYGNLDGTWNNYPTGSDSAPWAVASGTAANTAVYGGQGGPADITSAGGLSPYGTMAQGGNVYEWMETADDGINNTANERRELRGGSYFYHGSDMLNASPFSGPSLADRAFGFRVASVPEPSSLSLLALGGVVVALRRRKK